MAKVVRRAPILEAEYKEELPIASIARKINAAGALLDLKCCNLTSADIRALIPHFKVALRCIVKEFG